MRTPPVLAAFDIAHTDDTGSTHHWQAHHDKAVVDGDGGAADLFLHYSGIGKVAQLAQGLKAALAKTAHGK
jgi:cold shock CspA family protein